MQKTWINFSRRRKIMISETKSFDDISVEAGTFSVEDLIKVDHDIGTCSNTKVCEFMSNFLANPYPIEVELAVSNLVMDKYDRPLLQFEVKMKNCQNLEHIEGVRKKLQEVLQEAVYLINDYGY